jgi:hypothetical protein
VERFAILDERDVWWRAAIEAGRQFGFAGERIRRGSEMPQGALGFIRPHADPGTLRTNQQDYVAMCERGTVLQDVGQVTCYENKTVQWQRWGQWMPQTWVLTSLAAVMDVIDELPLPIVSKANEGASSVNVRVIDNRDALRRHVEAVFAGRVMVNACSSVGRPFPQTGYVFLQEFVPHTITWRVNAIGDARAIFMRSNYPNRPVAQTGNTVPVKRLDDFTERLIAFSDGVFADLDTRWCALDVLDAGGEFRLIEASLAWPWPSPGDCDNATFFRSTRQYVWRQMWHCMFNEYREGAWTQRASKS